MFPISKRNGSVERNRFGSWLANRSSRFIACWAVVWATLGVSLIAASVKDSPRDHTRASTYADPDLSSANSTLLQPETLQTNNIQDIRVGELIVAQSTNRNQSTRDSDSSSQTVTRATAEGDRKPRSELDAPDGPVEIAITYTYDDPIGRAEATYLFPADEILKLPNDCETVANDLSAGEMILLRDGIVGTVTDVRPAPVGQRAPPSDDKVGDYRRVIGTVKHTVRAVMDVTCGGETLTCTPNHPFWVVDRSVWVPCGELRRGDWVRRADGCTTIVESVSRPRDGEFTVYNLEVEGLHTYYVGKSGVLVHNGGRCITDPFHGNDLRSTRATSLYKIFNNDGELVKIGISSNLARRYSATYLKRMEWKSPVEIAVGSRRYVYDLESQLIAMHRPPFNFNGH